MKDEKQTEVASTESFRTNIFDLRSALAVLARYPGELLTTEEPVDPISELAAVYRKIGAGTPVKPPTRSGPAMLFENVKGYDIPVIVGVLASRERVGIILGCAPDRLPNLLLDAVNNPVDTAPYSGPKAPCQEVVHKAPLDVRRILPAPTNTPLDAGPSFRNGPLACRRSGNRSGRRDHPSFVCARP